MSLGLGADIIERHFTIDKNLEGPDHILSSTKDEMKKLVSLSHSKNEILGTGEKIIQPSEYEAINSQRKSIYAKRKIKKNKFLTEKNIYVIRPAGRYFTKIFRNN